MFIRKGDFLPRVLSTHILLLSFLAAILIGTLLLKLPQAAFGKISWLDALFTATSAVCVTGLIVVDTATKFTLLGKIIILFLIQAGGLGIMTFAIFLIWFFKQRITLLNRMVIEESFMKRGQAFSLKYFLFFLLKYTFITELIGVGMYFFSLEENDLGKRFLFSVFHAVSAFCNAGFSLYSDSLMRYKADIPVNSITMALIILGGIGFLVIFEMRHMVIPYLMQKKKYRKHILSLHTWVVLITTLILIITGSTLLYIFELLNKNPLSLFEALFQSVTCRTAGFNTINISGLSRGSLLIMVLLMLIGGSPGSTAGGIKTTTFAVLFFILYLGTTNLEDVTVKGRTIPKDIVYEAVIIFLFSISWIFIVLVLLSLIQKNENVLVLLFETVSAFGTVGLSMGVTPHLKRRSKILIIITMLIGRLGSLTIFSLFFGRKKAEMKYAEENILVG